MKESRLNNLDTIPKNIEKLTKRRSPFFPKNVKWSLPRLAVYLVRLTVFTKKYCEFVYSVFFFGIAVNPLFAFGLYIRHADFFL